MEAGSTLPPPRSIPVPGLESPSRMVLASPKSKAPWCPRWEREGACLSECLDLPNRSTYLDGLPSRWLRKLVSSEQPPASLVPRLWEETFWDSLQPSPRPKAPCLPPPPPTPPQAVTNTNPACAGDTALRLPRANHMHLAQFRVQ